MNSGAAARSTVQVTSVTLSGTALVSPALPFLATSTLPAAQFQSLDLQFAAAGLATGSQHLLTVRGTYQLAGQTLGFTMNRFVTVTVPSGSVLTEIQHWVALDAVVAKANTLGGVDVATGNQSLLAFIETIPDFVQSGIDAPSSSVWAMFADGTPVIFGNDRKLPSNPVNSKSTAQTVAPIQAAAADRAGRKDSAGPALPPTEIPASSQVRNLWADGYQLTGDAIVNALVPWLKAENYTPNVQIGLPSDYDPSASVDALKSVGGDGVLYFATHGGFWGNGTLPFPLTFAVATSTPADPIRSTMYANDLQATPRNLVVYVPNIGGVFVPRYGITAAFVKTYWKNFSDNSFVYISACSSDDPRPSTNGIVPPSGEAVAQSAPGFQARRCSQNTSRYTPVGHPM